MMLRLTLALLFITFSLNVMATFKRDKHITQAKDAFMNSAKSANKAYVKNQQVQKLILTIR